MFMARENWIKKQNWSLDKLNHNKSIQKACPLRKVFSARRSVGHLMCTTGYVAPPSSCWVLRDLFRWWLGGGVGIIDVGGHQKNCRKIGKIAEKLISHIMWESWGTDPDQRCYTIRPEGTSKISWMLWAAIQFYPKKSQNYKKTYFYTFFCAILWRGSPYPPTEGVHKAIERAGSGLRFWILS